MLGFAVRIFARTIIRRSEEEKKSYKDLLDEYPKLTENDKTEILKQIEDWNKEN